MAAEPLLEGRDLQQLPELRERPEAWTAIARHIAPRPLMRSEGVVTELAEPLRIGGPLLAQCREVVARFDAFYRGVIAQWYLQPELRGAFLVDAMLAPAIEADRGTRTALPLSRLDCVLDEQGALRVIEINPVGICTFHLRAAAYLARFLRRAGLPGDAALLDGYYDALVDSCERYHDEVRGAPSGRRRIGVITPVNADRISRAIWREVFARHGDRLIEGQPRELALTPSGLALRGQTIDLLWGDFTFYFGYQNARYRQTRWASRADDIGDAEAETARLLGDPAVLERFADRRCAALSPARAYIALSKGLLSWIARADRPVDEAARPWLAAHVARTFDVEERVGGVLTVEEAVRRREELLVKPCQYGGAHGVVAGRDADSAEWTRTLEAMWRDPGWTLQVYHQPTGASRGTPIFGLYNYGGVLGGVIVHVGAGRVVSARRSTLVLAVADGGA
jgi:hypothetical protein